MIDRSRNQKKFYYHKHILARQRGNAQGRDVRNILIALGGGGASPLERAFF